MNKNPERPKEMNEIMFEVFGTGKKKKKKLPFYKEVEKEMSEFVRSLE